MPFVNLQVSIPVGEEKQQVILQEASRILAEGIGKPETYVMVALETSPFLMGGTAEPAAFADVRSIGGLTPQVNARLSAELAELLERQVGIPRTRLYANFTDVPASAWGYNGKTFG